MKIESISCQVRTARKQHVCELLHLHHKGEDDWDGFMFSRVIKILNEVNN
jgi:hypothetical protein